MEFNDDNIVELTKMISEEWESIVIIIDNMSNFKKQNWPLLVSLYNSYLNKNIEKNSKLKTLLDTNWLE